MVTKIKRESDKAVIESQAVALQSENESKYTKNLPKTNASERRKRLKELMSRLESMVSNRGAKKQRVKEFIPLIKQLEEKESEEELDQIEEALMNLMAKLEPHQFSLPLSSHPMTFGKEKPDEFKVLKAAKRAQLANKLWETDKMALQVQENQWENDFENATRH
jgi:hypothetical protein